MWVFLKYNKNMLPNSVTHLILPLMCKRHNKLQIDRQNIGGVKCAI